MVCRMVHWVLEAAAQGHTHQAYAERRLNLRALYTRPDEDIEKSTLDADGYEYDDDDATSYLSTECGFNCGKSCSLPAKPWCSVFPLRELPSRSVSSEESEHLTSDESSDDTSISSEVSDCGFNCGIKCSWPPKPGCEAFPVEEYTPPREVDAATDSTPSGTLINCWIDCEKTAQHENKRFKKS